MDKSKNLLVQLSRWSSRQTENFTTEAFVSLVSHLLARQPISGIRIIAHLTGNRLSLNSTNKPEIEITTQAITNEGRPDIRIVSAGFLGFVEVKLGAALGTGQLSSYRKELAASGITSICLTLLTRYPYSIPAEEQPDTAIRWFQVAGWLQDELLIESPDPVCVFLIQQFLDYLEALNITFHQVRSGISASIRTFTEQHGTSLINFGRIRNPDRLTEFPELIPLHNLILIIGEAVSATGLHAKFDSGQGEGGWIGYNLDNMAYFLCLYYSEPEIIVFETYFHHFNPGLWDGRIGTYMDKMKPPRWQHRLDLISPELHFFESPKEKQLRVIEDFIQESLRVMGKYS